MRHSISPMTCLAIAIAVGFGPAVANLAAQPAKGNSAKDDIALLKSLAITITGPKEGYVEQPITFQVQVVNNGDQPTPATEIRVAPFAQEQRPMLLKVDALKPKESRSLPVSLVATRVGPFDVIACFGKQAPTLLDSILYARRAMTQVQVSFDPSTPARKFLPAPPSVQASKPRLPGFLEEVPEVSFEDRLPASMSPWQVRNHIAATIDKINHVSQKKTDDYMQTLVKERGDLAGLPFAMGDACRMKKEQRVAFSDTVGRLRMIKQFLAFDMADVTFTMMDRGQSKPGVANREREDQADRADIAGLVQVLAPEKEALRAHLAKYLAVKRNADSTKALAKLAIFAEEASVRDAALEALKDRPAADATDILVQGLSYPWPDVAQRASSAIATLKRTDLIPQLRAVLKRPDPRAPEVRDVQGKKVQVVRELVRINHHRNCLLCHSPGTSPAVGDLVKDGSHVAASLTAPVLLPNVPFPSNGGYEPARSNPDILVRIDVTYLRQDFSAMMTVPGAAPWPVNQRFDFLVRTREVSAEDAQAYSELLRPAMGARSPYHVAAMTALTALGSNR